MKVPIRDWPTCVQLSATFVQSSLLAFIILPVQAVQVDGGSWSPLFTVQKGRGLLSKIGPFHDRDF